MAIGVNSETPYGFTILFFLFLPVHFKNARSQWAQTSR